MALLPTCGRFYAFYNIKWVYCISLVVFELGSVISAVAPNSMTLIIGRAVSGMGAAGLVSGTTTILSYCVALRMQAKLSPFIMGMFSIGSAVGPLVGGAITDSPALTWRFIFWINLRRSCLFPESTLLFPSWLLIKWFYSIWRCWASSHLVHLEEPPACCARRTAVAAEDTPTRYSGRYYPSRRDIMLEPGSAMGWHCLSMV